MKKKALVIFGWEFRWEHEFLVALEEQFVVRKIYFLPELRNMAYAKLVASINDQIRRDRIDTVLFNIDYLNNIDFMLINAIEAPVKGVFSHDDPSLHLRNSVTCLLGRVHFIIVSDVLSVLKYRALGLEAAFLPLEGGGHYFSPGGIERRSIDVLFIGQAQKADRAIMIAGIRAAGVDVRIEGGPHSRLTYAEMIGLYQNAKIVLNFSKNDSTPNASLEMGLYDYVLEFKGRAIEAGLCGALCVTEYAPYVEILFPGGEMPTFSNSEQCASIVADLLSDSAALEAQRQRFALRCEALRPNRIAASLHLGHRPSRNSIRRIPDWYLAPSFVDRFRWGLIYRRPADVLAYFLELTALPISPLRKLVLAGKVVLKLAGHGLRAILRRIRVKVQRP